MLEHMQSRVVALTVCGRNRSPCAVLTAGSNTSVGNSHRVFEFPPVCIAVATTLTTGGKTKHVQIKQKQFEKTKKACKDVSSSQYTELKMVRE